MVYLTPPFPGKEHRPSRSPPNGASPWEKHAFHLESDRKPHSKDRQADGCGDVVSEGLSAIRIDLDDVHAKHVLYRREKTEKEGKLTRLLTDMKLAGRKTVVR